MTKQLFIETLVVIAIVGLFAYMIFLAYKESTYPCDQLQYMKPNLPERCL